MLRGRAFSCERHSNEKRRQRGASVDLKLRMGKCSAYNRSDMLRVRKLPLGYGRAIKWERRVVCVIGMDLNGFDETSSGRSASRWWNGYRLAEDCAPRGVRRLLRFLLARSVQNATDDAHPFQRNRSFPKTVARTPNLCNAGPSPLDLLSSTSLRPARGVFPLGHSLPTLLCSPVLRGIGIAFPEAMIYQSIFLSLFRALRWQGMGC